MSAAPTAAPEPLDEPCTMPPGSDQERAFHRTCAAVMDDWFRTAMEHGLDLDMFAADLKVAITQANLAAQRQAGAA